MNKTSTPHEVLRSVTDAYILETFDYQHAIDGEAGRAAVSTIRTLFPFPSPQSNMPEDWQQAAEQLADMARASGYVLTISQAPREPLAMGNHVDVVTVRAAQ